MKNKILFIGDIAGRVQELEELCGLFPAHRKIALGDLQDRGLFSKEVLDYIMENNIEGLYGNHEEMFLDFMTKDFSGLWVKFLFHGGWQTIASYLPSEDKKTFLNSIISLEELTNYYRTDEFKYASYDIEDSEYYKNNKWAQKLVDELYEIRKLIPNKYVEFIQSLPLYIKENDWVATHAPISQETLEDSLKDDMFVWRKWRASDKEIHQIYGHCNFLNLRKNDEWLVVCVDDTSNDRLSGFDWETKEFTHIDYKK